MNLRAALVTFVLVTGYALNVMAQPSSPRTSPGLSPDAMMEFQKYQRDTLARFDINGDGHLEDGEAAILRKQIEAGEFSPPPMPPLPPGKIPPELRIYDVNKNDVLDGSETLSLQIDALTGKLKPPRPPIPGGGPPLGNFAAPHLLPGHSAPAQLSPARRSLMHIDRVVEAMHIQKGSTIVDIGAGFGLFTFPFADAVGETGRVYAVDVDPEVIAWLATRIRELGLANIMPVRVNPENFDSFYARHKFDVIFLSDSIQFLPDPSDFLSKLRPSLNAGGRLWILALKLDADFTPEEFPGIESIRDALAQNPFGELVRKRLTEATRNALRDAGTDDPISALQLLCRDLNGILNDPDFASEIKEGGAPLDPGQTEIRKQLREQVDKAVAEGRPLVGSALARTRLLNRLLLTDILGTSVWEKAFSLGEYSTKDWMVIVGGMDFLEQIVPMVTRAGFTLIREHQILSVSKVWEFQ